MARAAREKNMFGVYYISQRADEGYTIFRNDADRDQFVVALQDAINQYPSELLAYCLVDPTVYHLIVRFHGGDISQFMASLRIRFARATDRSGLFRDRFHSELLDTEDDIHAVLDRLEEKGKKSKEWNSFCQLDRLRSRTSTLRVSLDRPSTFEISNRSCIASVKGLKIWLETSLEQEGLSMDDILEDRALRNEWGYKSRRMSWLTLKELGGVCGGISESMVSKIIKQGVHRAGTTSQSDTGK